ncbi:MAG: arginine N-succinyltransferase [Myxococcales bacterium]|nr:arginine N-succinyltransferase [Myxococcales bacterium]MCB9567509.1 arginine N-succinyltransferase [Myxococcales bacterium]
MFLFREALPSDEDAIFDLARHLNTLNLPPERSFIEQLLARSIASFRGTPDFDPGRRFLFVLEDPEGRVVGTSMIHAQHGDFDEPHVFFRVVIEERYADLVGPERDHHEVHMVHTMLHLGQTYDGPTELGGLVIHPDLRGHPDKLGRLLSLARFVFIASYRGWFRDRLLAELLPPLYKGPSGATRSPLWDALGHVFTGLSYEEADRLSRTSKDFIWRLFPSMPVHASLLPEGVREIIGKVGPNTIGAQRLLEGIGFKYSGRIDPFDGGPHLEATTDDVSIVRRARKYTPELGEPASESMGIVAVACSDAPHFRAVWTPAEVISSSRPRLRIGRAALERLGVLSADAPAPAPDARVFAVLRSEWSAGDQPRRPTRVNALST